MLDEVVEVTGLSLQHLKEAAIERNGMEGTDSCRHHGS